MFEEYNFEELNGSFVINTLEKGNHFLFINPQFDKDTRDNLSAIRVKDIAGNQEYFYTQQDGNDFPLSTESNSLTSILQLYINDINDILLNTITDVIDRLKLHITKLFKDICQDTRISTALSAKTELNRLTKKKWHIDFAYPNNYCIDQASYYEEMGTRNYNNTSCPYKPHSYTALFALKGKPTEYYSGATLEEIKYHQSLSYLRRTISPKTYGDCEYPENNIVTTRSYGLSIHHSFKSIHANPISKEDRLILMFIIDCFKLQITLN